MTGQYTRIALKRALDKSLEVLGEPSKKSLMVFLEREFSISFGHNTTPTIEELELALKSVLGTGAYIITEEFRKNLDIQAKSSRKRLLASKHERTSA